MSTHKPALAVRTAVVAATSAAAALFALLPAAAAPAAAATPVTSATLITQTAPAAAADQVRLVALSTPAAVIGGGAAPAAARASALQIALGKLGSPYRWGAAGPSAFDCSGLVTWAFKNAGISLPRTSRAQSTVGTPVAKSDLRPGDLVFFYKPVSHVAIYVGNGKVVHASTAGQPVKISNLSSMPFSGARRV